MKVETVELTPALVGLGDLHEPGLLALFADTHYRILVDGKSATPRTIANAQGEPLYPSVCALRLSFPPERPVDSHALWQRFDLGVDVRAFARQFLEVTCVLGAPGEVPHDTEAWPALALPRATWSSAWTVTRPGGAHELAMPSADMLANLPRLTKVPAGITAAREVFARGRLWTESRPATTPIRYPVIAGRDAAIGRQMMFSQFLVVMDAAERAVLGEQVVPAFPSALLDCLATTDRRIFYFGNCGAGDVIDVHVASKLERRGGTFAVRSELELVDAQTQKLLALADVEKLATIPPGSGLGDEIARLLASHGESTVLAEGAR